MLLTFPLHSPKTKNGACLPKIRRSSTLSLRCTNKQEIPKLLFPPVKEDKAVTFRLFDPGENKFVKLTNRRLPQEISGARCAGSSNGWLCFENKHKHVGLYLANMLSCPQIEIVPLPPLIRNDPRCFRFESLDYYNRFMFNRSWFGKPEIGEQQVVPLKIAISSSPNDSNCTIMILNHRDLELTFCRIGDPSWTSLGSQFIVSYSLPGSDIIFSKKHHLFYTMNANWNVQVWDLRNPDFPIGKVIDFKLCPYNPPKPKIAMPRGSYLVETPEGDILRVNRYQCNVAKDGSLFLPDDLSTKRMFPSKTIWFKVTKIDIDKLREEHVTCLGDATLFLGANESFSVSTKDYPTITPNCIYFNNDPYSAYEFYGKPYGGYDMGVYSLQDNTISPLLPFQFQKMPQPQPPPIWVFPRPN